MATEIIKKPITDLPELSGLTSGIDDSTVYVVIPGTLTGAGVGRDRQMKLRDFSYYLLGNDATPISTLQDTDKLYVLQDNGSSVTKSRISFANLKNSIRGQLTTAPSLNDNCTISFGIVPGGTSGQIGTPTSVTLGKLKEYLTPEDTGPTMGPGEFRNVGIGWETSTDSFYNKTNINEYGIIRILSDDPGKKPGISMWGRGSSGGEWTRISTSAITFGTCSTMWSNVNSLPSDSDGGFLTSYRKDGFTIGDGISANGGFIGYSLNRLNLLNGVLTLKYDESTNNTRYAGIQLWSKNGLPSSANSGPWARLRADCLTFGFCDGGASKDSDFLMTDSDGHSLTNYTAGGFTIMNGISASTSSIGSLNAGVENRNYFAPFDGVIMIKNDNSNESSSRLKGGIQLWSRLNTSTYFSNKSGPWARLKSDGLTFGFCDGGASKNPTTTSLFVDSDGHSLSEYTGNGLNLMNVVALTADEGKLSNVETGQNRRSLNLVRGILNLRSTVPDTVGIQLWEPWGGNRFQSQWVKITPRGIFFGYCNNGPGGSDGNSLISDSNTGGSLVKLTIEGITIDGTFRRWNQLSGLPDAN